MLTTDTVTAEAEGKTYNLSADQMAALGAELTYTGEAVADGRVTVPAGGSAQVKVEIQIPAKAVEHMKALAMPTASMWRALSTSVRRLTPRALWM